MDKKYYKTLKICVGDSTYFNGYFTLDYYILISNIKDEYKKTKKSYGIEIVKQYTDTFQNCITQSADTGFITQSKVEIYSLVEKLFLCSVTPISLKDVVDDYLYDKENFSKETITKGA